MFMYFSINPKMYPFPVYFILDILILYMIDYLLNIRLKGFLIFKWKCQSLDKGNLTTSGKGETKNMLDNKWIRYNLL